MVTAKWIETGEWIDLLTGWTGHPTPTRWKFHWMRLHGVGWGLNIWESFSLNYCAVNMMKCENVNKSFRTLTYSVNLHGGWEGSTISHPSLKSPLCSHYPSPWGSYLVVIVPSFCLSVGPHHKCKLKQIKSINSHEISTERFLPQFSPPTTWLE